MKDLAVFLSGARVGTIRQRSGLRFRYDEAYLAGPDPTPLSLSMPLSEVEHGNRVTLSWVNGLLPADREVRARVAERGGVRSSNPAALLTVIGLDCPGAVQVTTVDRVDEVTRPAELVPVDDDWIGARLALLRRDEAAWQIADERWSIGGGQSKFTLARDATGRWCDPRGAAASTHIVKPGVPTARMQALNEHVSLVALRALDIPAAHSEYREFAGQPALVVRRFDRVPEGEGVRRVHAEDLCQAVGNQTTYERYGGPSARDLVDLLRSRAPGAPERFAEALMATYLLGSPDGHARNYSVLLAGSRAVLAPLYDVASSWPYEIAGAGVMHQRKVALSIGGERTFGLVGADRWQRFFTTNSLDPLWGFQRLRTLADRLPDALARAFGTVEGVPGADELRARYVDSVARSCGQFLEQLDSAGR